MATFNGISFTTLALPGTGGVYSPVWTREKYVSQRHVAYANLDDVQSGGLGDWQITVKVRLADEDALAQLEYVDGGTPYALTDLRYAGDDYPAVKLIKIADERKQNLSLPCYATLTFSRNDADGTGSGASGAGGNPGDVLTASASFTADTSVAGEVTIDPNGSTSSTGQIAAVNVEWGDGQIWTANGPWPVGAVDPIVHAYATPADYQINMSVVVVSADGTQTLTSSDDSQIVTIT